MDRSFSAVKFNSPPNLFIYSVLSVSIMKRLLMQKPINIYFSLLRVAFYVV